MADIGLTAAVFRVVRREWGLSVDGGEWLSGGEESACYRSGDRVVRLGPTWRTTAELDWAYTVARQLAQTVAEVVAPLPTSDGRVIVRVEHRPVSVWPFVAGDRAHDEGDPAQLRQAAALLARLHRAARPLRCAARPAGREREPATDLCDPALDSWVAAFDARHPVRLALHGDFYPGNALARNGQLVALLDWDDALVGVPERELASAAWEWSDGLETLDCDGALAFIAEYASAGGPARPLNDLELRQLVRERIRGEVAYDRARLFGEGPTDEDRAYEVRQLQAFWHLRP